ncbi:TPA: hypothetical protein MDV13_000289 [Klebsiella pneumoniae]|uniref:hypothetical protein n=2 Tax=Klebsiella/Raoultella group TaxID=2890311 RepID=UPI001ABA5511|nr:hypothetical protein [Raoultella ornithinolytica]MCB3777020.1 hypothetical protein [Klebsiella pneumoniae]MCF6667462.1 hypothetical protein [Raoultella ornithinolytica]HBV2564901.1 hypothetical protein [Klebsiella pneumoniae]HBV2569748.1 hypothetical protein [Klebsiella pneumoniae]HBV2652304.1 hypothetical protein [Klebsiella pneumoniae]
MSTNKGKDGEMRVLRLITHIVQKEENCDVTRHTNTNTADSGADLVLEHPHGFLPHLGSIASGEDNNQLPDLSDAKKVKTRIDVKTTESKLGPDVVKKFAGDIRRNPDCDGHVLMGGIDLSDQAKSDFKEIQDTQAEVGKTVVYIPNSGIENLEQHYTALPKSSSGDEDQT